MSLQLIVVWPEPSFRRDDPVCLQYLVKALKTCRSRPMGNEQLYIYSCSSSSTEPKVSFFTLSILMNSYRLQHLSNLIMRPVAAHLVFFWNVALADLCGVTSTSIFCPHVLLFFFWSAPSRSLILPCCRCIGWSASVVLGEPTLILVVIMLIIVGCRIKVLVERCSI